MSESYLCQMCAKSLPAISMINAIDLDITTGCNLACPYCFKHLGTPKNMTLQTAKDSIEWLIRASGSSKSISVNFMGGEPLLRYEAMREIVKWGKRRSKLADKSIYFSFTTNMTLFTEESRKWIDDFGLGVLMSIDGLPEVQDTQRPAKDRKPKADVVAKWAKSLLGTRPYSDARTTTTPAFVDKLYETCIYLWEEIGFKSIILGDAAYSDWSEGHFRIYEDQLYLIADYIIRNYKQEKYYSLRMIMYIIYHLLMNTEQGGIVTKKSPCGAGYNYCLIDYEGNIWPCHRFDGAAREKKSEHFFMLGNIYNTFNDKLSNVFRNYDFSKMQDARCKSCPIEAICGGGCLASNLEHGDNTIYDPHKSYCRLKQINYSIANYVYNELNNINTDRCKYYITEYAKRCFK